VELLDSLVDAIVRLEGDALVMHVGEKPYVVTTTSSMNEYRGPLAWGQVELSSRVLTSEAVLGMLGQILPHEQRQALEELGAIEHEVPLAQNGHGRFTIIAARGGDDVWLEVRRKIELPEPVHEEVSELQSDLAEELGLVNGEEEVERVTDSVEEETTDTAPFELVDDPHQHQPTDEDVDELLRAAAALPLTSQAQELAIEEFAHLEEEPAAVLEFEAASFAPAPALAIVAHATEPDEEAPVALRPAIEVESLPQSPEPTYEMTLQPHTLPHTPMNTDSAVPRAAGPGSVRPFTHAVADAEGSLMRRILFESAATGASNVYLVAQSRPMLRIEGEISALEGHPVLSAADVQSVVAELAGGATGGASSDDGECQCTVAGIGRVRYVTFEDHRGPGVIFRLVSARAISAEQLGLSPEVQALCHEPDGLVLVAGAPHSGRSSLLNAFIDLVNRSRSDHVVSIESQIGFVHENRRSFVSQREGRSAAEMVAVVRRALHEDPDVLVLDEVSAPETAQAALEAAESGRLVFASIAAPSAASALNAFMQMFPAEQRDHVKGALASTLRAVIAQTLLRKAAGGRTVAREVLLNGSAVAALIRQGNTAQLASAMEAGKPHGMMPLTDALAALVRSGAVHIGEAYRKAVDRESLLAMLKREGVDTSIAERLA
jgi:twitching motility protein PilT